MAASPFCTWLADILCGVIGLWGLYLSWYILVDVFGVCGSLLAVLFFPLVLLVAPWYAALVHHEWFPLLLVCGGHVGAVLLYALSAALNKEPLRVV